jgi:DNA/RNA-binding domain of Phe-tRNA-synthetase-like protein
MHRIQIDKAVTNLTVAVAAAEVRIAAADDSLQNQALEVAKRTAREGLRGGETRRTAVRQLLRAGGFRPSGRNKPAQEYLLRSATQDGALPQIWNVVDLINVVSLDAGLPISLLAANRTSANLRIRYGGPDESFVFNAAGQTLKLAGLICLCQDDGAATEPLGTPVKDSMRGKVVESDTHVLACLYAPKSVVEMEEAADWARRLGQGFVDWCGAEAFESCVVTSTS